jgi:lysophospholipase L1-like esterase
MHRRILYKLTSILSCIFIIICASEIILNFIFPSHNKYCLWLPCRKAIFKPYPQVMPGVSGNAVFATNSQGVRGDELTDKQHIRILAVGGSTTECLYIDQQKTWSYILQNNLSSAYGQDVWVGNIGRSGLSTTGNLIELKYLLPQYRKIDLIIALVGFNDFQSALLNTFISNSLKSDQEKIGMVFVVRPSPKGRFYENSALWRTIYAIINYCSRKNRDVVEDSVGSWYIGARRARKMAQATIDTLPDLSADLKVFENNVDGMIDLARQRSIRIIFLTQPYIWSKNLTPAENDLLWFGFAEDKKKYYSTGALIQGLEKFNSRLREICMRRNVECIDLASLIPHDTSAFYDDVHFNGGGCQKVADIISGCIIGKRIKIPAPL